MSAIYLLLPISLLVALAFLAAFIWAVRSGQYEDTCTPALRILTDDPPGNRPRKQLSPRSNATTSAHER